MKIVEFEFDHPVLETAFERAPGVTLEWIKSDVKEQRERIQVMFWATGSDIEAFEGALEADPTVSAPQHAVSVADRRLLKFDLVGRGWKTSFYPLLVEVGGVIQSLSATAEGWQARIAFPDDSSVSRFFEYLDGIDITFEVHRIFDERGAGHRDAFGLTRAQIDALVAAVEVGYLDVPRTGSLQDLGDALGVSDQAASERVRRGVKQLVEETVQLEQAASPPTKR
jgi:hypothetical protein